MLKKKNELNEVRNKRVISSVGDDFEWRTVRTERKLTEQEQYTMRECMDTVQIPKSVKGVSLESSVLNVFDEDGIPMKKRDFHAIHRLGSTQLVIAKVCNRRDVTAILCNEKKLLDLS